MASHAQGVSAQQPAVPTTHEGIDVTQYTRVVRSGLRDPVPRGADARAVAIDRVGGKIYWAEYAERRIRRANLDGSDVETVALAPIDAPVAVAIDAAGTHLYWATDSSFPRRIQRAKLDGTAMMPLVAGEALNRPGAIALDASADKIYWVESVSGRIQRASTDGSSIEKLVEERVLTSFGLALDPAAGKIYWSDFAGSKLERADLDGDHREYVVAAGQGVDAPAGIALDIAAGKIYWADRGTATIRRADLDGWEVEDLLTVADGLIEPYGIAVDPEGGKLYWTDTGTDKLQRANLDGSDLIDLVAPSASPPSPTGGAAAACRTAVGAAGEDYVRRSLSAMTVCLEKTGWVKAVKWRTADVSRAAATCTRAMRRIHDTRTSARSHATGFRERLRSACGRGDDAASMGALSEIGAGISPLFVADDLAARCRGTTAADSFESWSECSLAAHRDLVHRSIAIRYPRALEWIREVRPFVAALEAPADDPSRTADAVAALEGLRRGLTALSEPDDADPDRGTGFPPSGQLSSYAAARADGGGASVLVPDDAIAAEGRRLRYVDNVDGTVTDLVTGLMWEKKCDRCSGLHAAGSGYRWSGDGVDRTIWDWLDEVNAEGGRGFAGYDDWRIPNIKELISIVDYERFNPAVDAAFDGDACGLTCIDLSDARCSCTGMSYYWSSTTFADFPAHAFSVGFHLGLVGDHEKTTRLFVRAVRGGR